MDNKLIVNAYIDMALERINQGFQPYLLSLMFNPIPANPKSRQEIMHKEATRLYSKLLTRVFRRPAKLPLTELPLWIGACDWPVPKSFKDHLFNIALNDGQHMHVVALQPPMSRMKNGLILHIDDNQLQFHGREHAFFRIQMEEIDVTPENAVGYALKSLARRRIESKDVLILPQTHDQMSKFTPYEREQLQADAQNRKAARMFAASQN